MIERQDVPDPESRFINAWRKWAGQPARWSPEAAAARFQAHLSERRGHKPVWRLAAAAAVMACLAVWLGFFWVTTRSKVPVESTVTAGIAQLGEGEVLMWLDDKTPLYMTFQVPGGNSGR